MSTQTMLTSIERANCLALLLGIGLSSYGLYVELRHDLGDPDYEPMCDVSETISCTKALGSSFATGLGIVEPLLGKDHILNQKNALYGIVLYSFLIPLQFTRNKIAVALCWGAAIFMSLTTVYLFTVLVYLRTVCLVCYGVYAVNASYCVLTRKRRLLLAAIREAKGDSRKKKKKN